MPVPPKPFGRRGVSPPPVVTRQPQGFPGGPPPRAPRQLRSQAIAIGAVGAAAILAFALMEAANQQNCPPKDDAHPDAPACQSSDGHSGGGHGGGGASHAFSSSSAETSHASFGGFGGAGAAHGGGGGE